MKFRNPLLLLGALMVAGLFAFLRTPAPPATPEVDAPHIEPERAAPANEQPVTPELPMNHPPLGPSSSPGNGGEAVANAPAITWQEPKKWKVAPNANSMRLVTYHVPAAKGASEEAELTVVRAGGSPDANIQRWVGQFADRSAVKRTKESVAGLEISVVEVSGTFQGGGMGPGGAATHPAWTLLGAIVETEGGSYFFKLTGPTASVEAARKDFDALIDSIAPAGK